VADFNPLEGTQFLGTSFEIVGLGKGLSSFGDRIPQDNF